MTFFEQLMEKLGGTFFEVSSNLWTALSTSMAHVSIELSIDLGQKVIRISHLRKTAVTWILARVFEYLPSFFSKILDFSYRTVLIFFFIYFE